jgi:hypothetical protein
MEGKRECAFCFCPVQTTVSDPCVCAWYRYVRTVSVGCGITCGGSKVHVRSFRHFENRKFSYSLCS